MRDDRGTDGRRWLSVREAAETAGVCHQTIRNWIWWGRLQPLPDDDGYRINATELSEFLAARRVAASVGIAVTTLMQWAESTD
jgi:excisionase family DNA binding protein